MQFATGRYMCGHTMGFAYTADHVCTMVRRVFDGRVAFHDGDREIAPGVSVHLIGGHTMGVQCVRVLTKRGWVVLASDASHFYENMEAPSPFPLVYSLAEMLDGYDKMRGLAESNRHIIPGHDPMVMDRYPAAKNAIADVVVRLDADPKE